MRPFLHQFDLTIIQTITSLPTWLYPFFIVITQIGNPLVTLGIGAAIAIYGLRVSNTRLAFSGATVWIVFGIGSALKLLVGRERPHTEYAANIMLDSLSFPSGHSSGSAIAFGLLAYFAWKSLPRPFNYIATALLIVLVLLVGISRIYLGAHFPSDVIGGWLLGAIILVGVIFIVKPQLKR